MCRGTARKPKRTSNMHSVSRVGCGPGPSASTWLQLLETHQPAGTGEAGRVGLHIKVAGQSNKVTKRLSTHVHVNEVGLNLHVRLRVGVQRQRAHRVKALSSIWGAHVRTPGRALTGSWRVFDAWTCHTSPRSCARVCVCVCDQHVSPVCVSASVAQALVSLRVCDKPRARGAKTPA